MKIYDMIEGKWLKIKKEKNDKDTKDYKAFDISTRLVTHDEEKEYIKSKKTLDKK
jgi:hypothetical protein